MRNLFGFYTTQNPITGIVPITTVLSILFTFSSCYSYGPLLQPGQPVPLDWQKESKYFIPTTFNAPMLDSAELAAVSFNTRTVSNDYGIGVDAAVRLTPKWAVMGNVGSYNMGDQYKTETDQWEVGAGYTGRIVNNFKWEAFAGTGAIRYDMIFFDGYAKIKTNYYYVQPAIYYHQSGSNPHFTIGVATRFAMQTPEVSNKYLGSDNPQLFTQKQLSILESANTLWALEPGLVVRIGWNPIQLTAQYFGIVYLNAGDLHGKSSMFNVGLRFALPKSVLGKN